MYPVDLITKALVFWCDDCDQKQVNSADPSTGAFYIQNGHQYSSKNTDCAGEYVGVIYALCPDCNGKGREAE